MMTARVIMAVALAAVAFTAGCGQMGKPPVDKTRAESAIKAIQADPHMLPNQKAAMIAEIQKQIN